MILSILFTILMTVLVTIGVYNVTSEGQLFHFVEKLAKKIAPLNKPICDCVICMAGSLWNIITVLLLSGIGILPAEITLLPIIVINGLASAGIVSAVYELLYE